MTTDIVRDGYDRLGARYLEWTRGSAVRLGFLGEVLERLAPRSDVIELGCGPGEPVTRALSEHHRVTAVDLSPGQLALARHAAPAATFLEADAAVLGGLMLISTPAGAGDGIDADWLGVPMYFGGLAVDDTLAAASRAGLDVERAEIVPEDEHGATAEFLWLTATKRT